MDILTNKELAALCAAQAGCGYVWGGLGYALTESRLVQLRTMYKWIYTDAYIAKARRHMNTPVFDCVGLVKFFLWGNTKPGVLEKYATNNIPDTSANGMLGLCKTTGKMSAFDDRPGLLLHRDGHVGISLGGGRLVEARGADYGVVLSNVKDRDFTEWGELPLVAYVAGESVPDGLEEQTDDDGDRAYFVVSGDTPWGIASRYFGNGMRYKDIMKLNGLDENAHIFVGQSLKLPPPDKTGDEIEPVVIGILAIGDTVKITGDMPTYTNGIIIPADVRKNEYTVAQISKTGAKILLREIFSWVFAKDLTIITKVPEDPFADVIVENPESAESE